MLHLQLKHFETTSEMWLHTPPQPHGWTFGFYALFFLFESWLLCIIFMQNLLSSETFRIKIAVHSTFGCSEQNECFNSFSLTFDFFCCSPFEVLTQAIHFFFLVLFSSAILLMALTSQSKQRLLLSFCFAFLASLHDG